MEKTDYEEALKKLEEVIEQLENKELSLDDSLKFFKEGIDLYRFCNKKLNEAEEKVMLVVKKDGQIKDIPFMDLED